MDQSLSNLAPGFQTFGREREARRYNQTQRISITKQPGSDRYYSSLSDVPLSAYSLADRQRDRWGSLQDTQAGTPHSVWIDAALTELNNIDDEVAEDALPEIHLDTKDKARKIIFALTTQPIAPTVYPTGDGEIALYFKSPIATSSVLILLGNDGQAACFSYVNGKNRRARYEDASELPDVFVMAQLRKLADA